MIKITIDGQEYEAVINKAIKDGRSHPIPMMFYAFAGLKKGILPVERAVKLGDLLSNAPTFEWFASHNPPLTKKDIEYYCKEYFDEEVKTNKPGKKFKNFYRTIVSNHIRVQSRTSENTTSSRTKDWDKDSIGAFGFLGDARQASRIFKGKSGNEAIKPDAVANVFSGALDYCEEMTKNINKVNFKKEFTRQAAWIATATATVENRADIGSDTTSRTDSELDSRIPSAAGITNNENMTFGERRKKLKDFLIDLEPKLFELLEITPVYGKGKDNNDEFIKIKEYLIKNYSKNGLDWNGISKINDVYENMNRLIQVIISEYSDEEFKKRIIKNFSLTGKAELQQAA